MRRLPRVRTLLLATYLAVLLLPVGGIAFLRLYESALIRQTEAELLAQAAVLSAASDALARAGVTVVGGWPEGVDPVGQAASFGFQVRLFFAYQQPDDDLPPFAEVVDQERRRMQARVAWGRYFEDVDVFLCPASFTAAFPHDSRPFEAQPSLPGLPAVAAPVGRTAGGLPVGAQVVGPLHEDDTAITFAELLGEVAGGYQPPPL